MQRKFLLAQKRFRIAETLRNSLNIINLNTEVKLFLYNNGRILRNWRITLSLEDRCLIHWRPDVVIKILTRPREVRQ